MTTINTRTLQREMKQIAKRVQKGEHFVVLKNMRPIFHIKPFKEKTKSDDSQSMYDAFKDLQFHGKEKNLSKKIDEIVYDL